MGGEDCGSWSLPSVRSMDLHTPDPRAVPGEDSGLALSLAPTPGQEGRKSQTAVALGTARQGSHPGTSPPRRRSRRRRGSSTVARGPHAREWQTDVRRKTGQGFSRKLLSLLPWAPGAALVQPATAGPSSEAPLHRALDGAQRRPASVSVEIRELLPCYWESSATPPHAAGQAGSSSGCPCSQPQVESLDKALGCRLDVSAVRLINVPSHPTTPDPE